MTVARRGEDVGRCGHPKGKKGAGVVGMVIAGQISVCMG